MLINRRQKFPEPPPPASHHNNNSNTNNSDCVVVSVATSSNNDPFSGKTVIFGDSSSSQHQDFSDSSNSTLNNVNLLHDNGKSKSNGVIANLLTSIIAPSTTSNNNNNNNDPNNNSNFILPTVFRRLSVLVSLLLLQSLSQFVLEAFEDVVQANIVIPLFLTMLVGAGGNAGNQSAVRAIAMLARGELNATTKLRQILPFVKRECVIGFICAFVLSMIGALRVFVHQFMKRQHHQQNQHQSSSPDDGDDANSPTAIGAAAVTAVASAVAKGGDSDVVVASIGATVLAISLSLFLIVALSCVIGVTLPFVFLRFGMSPEHAAPAIQVIMDVLGVFLTCVVCSVMLPSSPHKT